LKLKLDEHLGASTRDWLIAAGYDALTVRDQGLQGTPDERLLSIVASEGRALITLDRGFANYHLFAPGTHAGILVLRPTRQSPARVLDLLRKVLSSEVAGLLPGAVVIAREQGVRVFAAK